MSPAPSFHQVRPGLVMAWGCDFAATASRPAEDTALTARFAFILASDAHRRDDRMILLRPDAPIASPSADAPAIFHTTLSLSETALDELLSDDDSPGAQRVRAFALSADAIVITLPLTSGARLAVESIRRCPFAGACRAMALTARCNDLLVEFLHSLSSTPLPAPPPTAGVVTQIHAAAELLRQHLELPPSLAALARAVGLSETTLKRGFHRVFDTTVFGYLRTCRMEHAHALLLSGEATVLEAAALVGYSNPSNFSAAFRRRFGINPKEFQLTARR